jgi:hypothetical protein
LVKISTDSFYPLQVPVLTAETPKSDASPQEEGPEDLLHGNLLYDQTSQSLDELLKTILDRDMSNNGLNSIFKHIEPWLTSVNEHERLRSIKSLTRLLSHFASHFTLDKEV